MRERQRDCRNNACRVYSAYRNAENGPSEKIIFHAAFVLGNFCGKKPDNINQHGRKKPMPYNMRKLQVIKTQRQKCGGKKPRLFAFKYFFGQEINNKNI